MLAELGRLNSDVVPLTMKIMDGSATVTVEEQYVFAKRLVPSIVLEPAPPEMSLPRLLPAVLPEASVPSARLPT